MDMGALLIIATVAFAASAIGTIGGVGGTIVLLPVLVWQFGIHQAIPLMSLFSLAANIHRSLVFRAEVSWPVAGWLSAGVLPTVALGALLFTLSPPALLHHLLGGFLIGVVLLRRIRPAPPKLGDVRLFLPLGLVYGLLTGLLSGVGPLLTPFLMAHGLKKGSYVGTFSVIRLGTHSLKLLVFGLASLLNLEVLFYALLLLPSLVAGTMLGKRVLNALPELVFRLLLEAIMLGAGLSFLLRQTG